MSFSRAPLKRFNENVGCAPPPGAYEIKTDDLKGAASFDKSDRFRNVKAGPLPPPSPSRNALVSPVRRTMSVDGLAEGSVVKKERHGLSLEKKQQKLLEKEIRSLVQQRGEQDRRLLALEEELKKVEAKLLSAVRERSGLAANVTTLERQRTELKRVNEFLKNKVSADTTKKRINSLTMELMEARNAFDVKNKELKVLQINTEGRLKVLESDLQTARTTVTTLKDRNKDLEDLHQVTKVRNTELENENARLQAVIRELKEEIKVVQGYLDTANDQIQDLRMKLQEKTKENTLAGAQRENIEKLETKLEQCTTELQSARGALLQREEEALKFDEELLASKDALAEAERRLQNQELELKALQESANDTEEQMRMASQRAEDSEATVRQQEAKLARLREVLRQTEKELDERVAHMEQRYLLSEEERSKTQEEGLRRVKELQSELLLLKETGREEKNRQLQLEQEHAALTEELTKEKALVDSLSVLLQQEREESEERLRQLKEEMEDVLGELALLEDQEQKKQEVVDKSQEALQRLQEENGELERQLSDSRALLESKSGDVAALKGDHYAAMRELQEAHTNSLSKMADVVSELESTTEALKRAEGREKILEAEVERVTHQMKEEMDKVVRQKEEIDRMKKGLEEQQEKELAEAKQENSRMLLEVQNRFAQKEEEMKVMEASHNALIIQLQQELQLQTKEKEVALEQLEEQRGQNVTELQNEQEKAQQLLKEMSQEKEEMMHQFQQEREEKIKMQKTLQEERDVFEMERIDHQQTRSEVLRLEAELERVNKENKSQIELQDASKLALENQLNMAEQERNRLQSRLNEVEQMTLSLQTQLDLTEQTTQAMQCQVEEQQQDRRALQEQVDILTQEKVTLQWEVVEQRQELQRQIAEAEEQSCQSAETEHWRKQYEELFAKVRPFQEQLNAFAAERNALLNENGANQEELNKLSDAYARLLGHQNQKQKIKHVMKLKDENISLKQEISKLRTQVTRQKSDLDQLRSKLPGAARRKFDPSKAFQHDKENRETASEPLKEDGVGEAFSSSLNSSSLPQIQHFWRHEQDRVVVFHRVIVSSSGPTPALSRHKKIRKADQRKGKKGQKRQEKRQRELRILELFNIEGQKLIKAANEKKEKAAGIIDENKKETEKMQAEINTPYTHVTATKKPPPYEKEVRLKKMYPQLPLSSQEGQYPVRVRTKKGKTTDKMCPVVIRGQNLEYKPWEHTDLSDILEKLPILQNGAHPWIAKLEELMVGTHPATGDIKRLLANLVGVPAMEELFDKARLARYVATSANDSELFAANRGRLWGALRETFPTNVHPDNILIEPLGQEENPRAYVSRAHQMWRNITGNDPELNQMEQFILRAKIQKGLPLQVRSKLAEVVGLGSMAKGVYTDHIAHYVELHRKKKQDQREQDQETLRKLTQIQLMNN
ncbi:uncharacterized protein V6R79_015327 [Siganus canaliculatus]